jgi:hypothetical protein
MLEPQTSIDFGGGSDQDQPQDRDTHNVVCTSGIHRGTFPVGGMSVGRARLVLRQLITIEDEAVAVINGRIVENEEEQIIGEEVTHVAFVKPSAVKGAGARPPTCTCRVS